MINSPTDHEARLTALEIDYADLHDIVEQQRSDLRALRETIARLGADRDTRPA